MTKDEVKKLSIGLYRIFWKNGGWSLAAVGIDATGNHWLAPVNWVNGSSTIHWRNVSSAVQLQKGRETNAS